MKVKTVYLSLFWHKNICNIFCKTTYCTFKYVDLLLFFGIFDRKLKSLWVLDCFHIL